MGAGAAQNKLGELFVDIGVGGLGKTLKSLNSISASFLLTKNAAVQMVKPLVDMGVTAANSAVNIGKMASALGTTKLNAQKLQYYLKQYKSEGLIDDLAKIQNMYGQWEQRMGQIPMTFATAMAKLNLSWQNYNGSFESTLKLIQDVKNALKGSNFTPVEQLALLNQLGLGGWKYLFEKKDFNINDALSVTEADIEKQIQIEERLEKIKISFDELKQKMFVKLLDTGFLDKIEMMADGAIQWLKKMGITILNPSSSGKSTPNSIIDPKTSLMLDLLPNEAKKNINPYSFLDSTKMIKDVVNPEGFSNIARLAGYGQGTCETNVYLTNVVSGKDISFEDMSARVNGTGLAGQDVSVQSFVSQSTPGL